MFFVLHHVVFVNTELMTTCIWEVMDWKLYNTCQVFDVQKEEQLFNGADLKNHITDAPFV